MTGLICCTQECNLACSYCYEGNGKIHQYPNLEEINLKFENAKQKIIDFIDQLYEYNQQTNTRIIWHGGEPTLINHQLLDDIMNDQLIKCHDIKWAIQSNGTLITDNYAKMLSKHNASIGVSIDGLSKQHDKYRVFKNGNPTFNVIMNNINILNSNNVTCGALITITDNNIDKLIEIYNMFAEKNLNFNFNALFPNDNDTQVELSSERYAEKICDLFDYWINDNEHQITISPFMQIVEAFVGKTRRVPACHWSEDCSKSFCAIDTNGDLYPCEHWVGNSEYCFGNIKNGLEEELHNCSYFEDRVLVLKENDCKDCEIWELCYGGCPWNAYGIFGSTQRKDSSICFGRKKIIKHIEKVLRQNNKID